MHENTYNIEYRTLGRTGLQVSQVGLGGGGKSCLGRKKGNTDAQSEQVVRRALDLGINLIDTSDKSGTEGVIGRGIRGYERDRLVLSTKRTVSHGDVQTTATQFAESLENSLKVLATPYIDIMHFHGVLPHEYEYVVNELLPVLERFRTDGKTRFIGITEAFDRDREHKMLRRALADDYWDVMMVGFNMVNQSARSEVLARAQEKNVGILGMFAARRALTSAESFCQTVQELKTQGELSADFDAGHALEQLTGQDERHGPIAGIAYRYCRDEPGIHSVLMGTGQISHLEQNVKTFAEPPLTNKTRRFITENFGHISNFSGN